MADITASVVAWSVTESSNQPQDTTTIGAGLDDNLRAIQAGTAKEHAKGSDIPSASTTDIGASGTSGFVDVTGTTTITSLGTARAGITRRVRFTGALTLTHNSTSLILPGGVSITTANGDTAEFISLGSGNWLCARFTPVNLRISNSNITLPNNIPYQALSSGGTAGNLIKRNSSDVIEVGDSAVAGELRLITGGSLIADYIAGTKVAETTTAGFNVSSGTLKENGTRALSRNSAGAPAAQAYSAANAVYTFAHGLGQVPIAVSAWAVCTTASGSTGGSDYALGDVVFLTNNVSASMTSVTADATNVYIRVANNIAVVDKSTPSSIVALTTGKWNLEVRAWY